MDLDALLARVLSCAEPDSYASVSDWWRAQDFSLSPIDAAIAGGARADRIGFAFASGYAAALRAMVPSIGTLRTCVAATEENGAHPRAIQTRYENGRVRGKKNWVTLGNHAEIFLVVAKTGERENRPILGVFRVIAKNARILSSRAAPFLPEIEHAEVEFDCDGEKLPGDGYDDFLKPFRTVEDVHVHAALLAHFAALGMRASQKKTSAEIVGRLCAAIASAHSLATADAKSARVHVALAGLIAETEALLAFVEGFYETRDARDRFQRDKPLLQVAGKARAARFLKAWERIQPQTKA